MICIFCVLCQSLRSQVSFQKMSFELYANPISPPSRAVIITAQQLGIEYTLKEVDAFGGGTVTPEFLKINPNHEIPALVDNGVAIFESRAIMAYLVNKYAPTSNFYPQDALARAQVDKVLYFDASSYYASLKRVFMPIFRYKQEAPKDAEEEVKEKLKILETLIGEQKYAAGDNVTLADISLSVSVPIVKLLFADHWTPKLEAWYQRVGAAVPAVLEYLKQMQAMSTEQK